MKSSIKLMFFMGPMIFVNIWSMSDKSMNKKETVVDEKEKAELVKIKTIEFPNQGLRVPAILNIQEKEFLTGKTFAELIENKAKKNEKFILARVLTVVENRYVIHYFDAHALNKELLGVYPIRNLPQFLINPINDERIRTIEYFTIKKNEHLKELNEHLPEVLSNIVMDYHECFEFLCTSTDLFYSDGCFDLQNYFYLNCDELNQDVVKVLVLQGIEYFKLQNYKKAKEYWEKTSTLEIRNINLKEWASANNNLGNIYYQGNLGEPDYKKAKEYYEKGLTLEVKDMNLFAWANANFCLANIYYFGYLGVTDYQKAKEYYEKVVTDEVKIEDLILWTDAKELLEEIEKIEKEKVSEKNELVN